MTALARRIDALLHPTQGIKRGIIDRCENTKGGPDEDGKLIPVSVGEIREVHAVLSLVAQGMPAMPETTGSGREAGGSPVPEGDAPNG